jgi:rubrerythrin
MLEFLERVRGALFAEIRAVWKLIRILQEELFMFVFGTADDVFGMAIRIEENGFAFYNGAAKKTQETAVKKLFEELANMEQGHVTAFKSLRATMPAALLETPVWDPEGLAESYLQATADTHIFTVEAAQDRLKNAMTVDQTIDMAIQFEKDSVAFFLGMKELLSHHEGKDEINKLIDAEMEHVRMLSRAKRVLSRGGSTRVG